MRKNTKLYLLIGLCLATPLQASSNSPKITQESNYESFFQTTVNNVLNEDVFNPYVYDEFINIGFREEGFIEQAYEQFLKNATGEALFVDFPTYAVAVMEQGSFMERAYKDFTTFFPEKDNTSDNDNAQYWYAKEVKDYICPLDIELVETSPYGMRGGSMHYGSDVSTPIGTPIFAVEEGEAYKVDTDSKGLNEGGGRMIFIKHPDGNETRYMHLDAYAIKQGDYVEKGELIGWTGNTGRTTGSGHLHLELLIQGEWVDSDILYDKNKTFKRK